MSKDTQSNGSATIAEAPAPVVELKPLRIETVTVPVTGITPLIAHRWSEKAKRMMRDAQTGKSRQKKEPKDPEGEFNEARYRLLDAGDGFPAVAFKSAIVGATRHFDGLTMVQVKQAVFIHGAKSADGHDLLVPIDAPDPTMREDMVRVGMGTADLRYRPEYWPWEATLKIEFATTLLSAESLLNLIDAAGFGGVGEWRPSSPKGATGIYGRFEVKR
jgi:hypothetical protein